jgi:hypothetical protein
MLARLLLAPLVLTVALAACGGLGEDIPDARIPSFPRPDAMEDDEPDAGPTDPDFTYDPNVGKAALEAVHAAPVGAVDLDVEMVRVTMVKPAIDDDAAGFFVQADARGPALFVAQRDGVSVTVGDVVKLHVAETGHVAGGAMFAATAADQIEVVSAGSGKDVEAFAVDATAASFSDVAAAGRLVRLTDTIATPNPTLQKHVSAALDSFEGRLRVSASLAERADLANGCKIDVLRGVIWRHKTSSPEPTVYVIGYDGAEIHAQTCPGPRVKAAFSLGAGKVAVQFDRRMKKDSLSAAAFTVDGLAVTAAKLHTTNPRVVVLDTAAQDDEDYEVVVSTDVLDAFGAPVTGTLAERTKTFAGLTAPAVLRLTEVSPNVASSRDQVELVAVSGGTLHGLVLADGLNGAERLAVFKPVVVAVGDLVVVHTNPDATKVDDETTSKIQGGKANNHDDAWDVHGTAKAVTFTDRVLVVRHETEGLQDAVPFSNGGAVASRPSVFPYDVKDAIAAERWATPCAEPCTAEAARAAAVPWTSVGTTVSGKSVQRKAGAAAAAQASWVLRDGTLGAVNAN